MESRDRNPATIWALLIGAVFGVVWLLATGNGAAAFLYGVLVAFGAAIVVGVTQGLKR